MLLIFFFFFQAEDGIRDIGVTGVQTCALPIWPLADKDPRRHGRSGSLSASGLEGKAIRCRRSRSEERRVGKECRSRWSADQEKKNKQSEGERRRGPAPTEPIGAVDRRRNSIRG